MFHNIKDSKSIQLACDILNKGEIIIYPTDTLYGFGVDATNTQAIELLNQLKNREQVYSIIVNSKKMLNKYAYITKQQEFAINQYLPGPFTMILKKKESDLSNLISLNLKTVGIRMPLHKFSIKIVKDLNRPIITTSVNFHNSKPLSNYQDIRKKFKNVNMFYDENFNDKSIGSTIIDLTAKPHKILRQGDGKFIL